MPRIPTAEITVNGKRKIVNADDPRALEPQTPDVPASPEDVAKLKRDDVVSFLEAHSVEFSKSAKVDELRALLIETMFVAE